jgi:hypothetical protein
MPTTREEADKIVEISLEYLPPEKLGDLFRRLWDEVGLKTDNSSLKTSLHMLASLVPAYGLFREWCDSTNSRNNEVVPTHIHAPVAALVMEDRVKHS